MLQDLSTSHQQDNSRHHQPHRRVRHPKRSKQIPKPRQNHSSLRKPPRITAISKTQTNESSRLSKRHEWCSPVLWFSSCLLCFLCVHILQTIKRQVFCCKTCSSQVRLCLVAISFILSWNWGGAGSMVGFVESYLTWSGKQKFPETVGSFQQCQLTTQQIKQTDICLHISHCSRHGYELYTIIQVSSRFHIQSIEKSKSLWSVGGFFPRGLLESNKDQPLNRDCCWSHGKYMNTVKDIQRMVKG